MDHRAGHLEDEFEHAVSTLTASGGDNIVALGEMRRQHETLRERERRFRLLLDALPAAVYTTDAAGRLTYFNEAAAELWGHRPQIGSSEWCGSWKLFWTDGTPMPHAECPMAMALKEDRRVRGVEALMERPDGTRVPFIPYPTPLHDEAGTLVGAVNMLVDITERKQAEDRQTILLRELHHRVRNTLATVQAIMGSTAKSANTIEEFKTALTGRIGALAKTHLLLTAEESRTSVPLDSILHNELDAFDDGGERLTLNGPPVEIPSSIAVSLAMAVHELTTNSAKYGALSVLGGRVSVSWTLTLDAPRQTLEFDWVESGGPPVSPPSRRGFGSQLIETILPRQAHAKAHIDYRREGVHVHYSLPLPVKGQADRPRDPV